MKIIQVLLFILTYSSACVGCIVCCNCGSLNVTDPYLFVGEYLNMACTLNQETVDAGDNSSKLYFTYGNDIEVPKSEVVILNSTTLVMNKMMSSLAHDGPYHCRIRDPVNASHTMVKSTWIELEYPPKAVENFSCIIYDWDESMVCTWDLGVNYHNINNINTTLHIFYAGHYGSCPKMHLTNCTWTRGDGVSFDRNSMSFIVSVKNTKHINSEPVNPGWITIKQKDNVKPSKVDYLLARNNGSRCINLEWSHLRDAREKAFIITLSSKWNDDQIIKTKNFHENICELMPDTEYNVRIVTKPGFDKGYESEPEFNSTKTEQDLPGRSPEVSEGGFSISSESCEENKRSVIVYWKSIPREYQNGPMLGYHISVSSSEGYPHNIVIRNPKQLHLPLHLPCNKETRVSILAWGMAGNSTIASVITIPKKIDISQPYHVVVEAQKNSTDTLVEVSWKVQDDHPTRSCVVFYCQYDTECTNEIQWKEVYGNYSSKVIDHIQFDKKYRFGVSCDGSGFKWQTCYYFKSMEPIPPSTVEVTAYPEYSVTVDWSDPLCENSPYIENYVVSWCVADRNTKKCQGEVKKEKISSLEASSFVISNLEIKHTYGIRVQNEARYQSRLSDYSEMQFVKPTTSDLQKNEIIGITLGGLFLLMLAIAGIIFIIRQAAPRIRSINQPFEIQDIKFRKEITYRPPSSSDTCTSSAGDTNSSGKPSNGHVKGKELVTQISKDSGRGSITSELHSPGIENKQGDLFAVEEESCDQNNIKDKNNKFPSNNNKNETPLLDPYYSLVTLVDTKDNFAFRQDNFNLDMIAAPVHASFPNIHQRNSQNSDVFSLLSNRTSVYKSSSEEKMLVNLDEDDNEDGYKDIGRRCKSLDTVRPDSYQDDKLSSYVRQHTDDLQSVGTNESSCDLTDGGLCPLMPPSNDDNPPQLGINHEVNNIFDPMMGLSVKEPDLKSIIPDVVFCPTKQTQDQKKPDYLRMNSVENPKLHIPMTPVVDTRDENSYFSSFNNGYISEENIQGQGHSVSKAGQQDIRNSGYISEPTAINSGYVTEESLKNDEAETSVSRVENQNQSGYVAEQDLLHLNNSSGCKDSKGNSGGYVTEDNLQLVVKANLSGNGSHSENNSKLGYVSEQELLHKNTTIVNSEGFGNSSGDGDDSNPFLFLTDHQGLEDSSCSRSVDTPSTSQGSGYVLYDIQKGVVPSTDTHL